MSIDTNKALVRRHIEMLDQKNFQGMIATCAPDAIFHGLAPRPLGVGEYQHILVRFLKTFPDARFLIGDMIAEDEKVALRFTIRGTHRAALRRRKQNGNRATVVAVPVMSIIHIAEDQITEVWVHVNLSDLAQHVGPAPALNRIAV